MPGEAELSSDGPVAGTAAEAALSSTRRHRALRWLSACIVSLGLLGCLVSWFLVVVSWSMPATRKPRSTVLDPMELLVAALVCTVIAGLLCLPQYFGVFRRSLRAAGIASRVSLAFALFYLGAAVIVPLILAFTDPRSWVETASLVIIYVDLAVFFLLNRWLLNRWRDTLAGGIGDGLGKRA